MTYPGQQPDPRVGRVNDPPLRPTPEIPDRDSNKNWIPGKTRRNIPVSAILSRVIVGAFVVGALAGIFLIASKVFSAYLG